MHLYDEMVIKWSPARNILRAESIIRNGFVIGSLTKIYGFEVLRRVRGVCMRGGQVIIGH